MTTFASKKFKTLSYCEDGSDNYGGDPTASETLRYLPYTSENFAYSKESIDSATTTQSRQKQDSITVGFETSGGLEMEWAPKAYDEFIEGALWKRWGDATDFTGTLSFDADAKTITATGTPFANIVSDQFVKVSGASNAANNGVFQVASVATDNVITLKNTYTLADESNAENITLKACMIRNAADSTEEVRISYFVEKCLQDMTPVYRFSYRGQMVNTISMSAQTKAIITGSIAFMGTDSESYSDQTKSAGGGGSVTSAFTTEKLNAVYHIGGIRIDGVDLRTESTPTYFSALDFTINNNLRGIPAVGELGNVSVAPDMFTVEGNISPYFTNDDMYQKFLNGTSFSLSYEAINSETGEGYVFYFPYCKIQTSGMDGDDIQENIAWTALEDETLGITVQIDRFLADYTTAPDYTA